ncbi:hypothetical protein ACIRS3_17570 [Streptomyces virginiae]|uniref:hypothetical protein n=1 Tax=Streptomyces virginiae TaxID=1961 RepID=UPI0038202E38
MLIVEAADKVLPADPADRRMFFTTLLRAGRRWSYTRKPDSLELGRLVVVLCCDTGSAPALRAQLQSCGEDGATGAP